MGDGRPGTDGGPPLRVYVLDDHEVIRRGMRQLLARAGGFAVVGQSGSAREAAARIPALHPDVALLDVQLPDGSGIDVCRTVRSQDPTIRVLMVTSYDDRQATLAAVLAGASGLVLKQLRGPDLTETIRRVARGEMLLGEDEVATLRRELSSGDDPRLRSLTGQEHRILGLIVDGLTNAQIGSRLDITEKTVKNHVTSLLLKLGLQSRTQAAVYAIRSGTGPAAR